MTDRQNERANSASQAPDAVNNAVDASVRAASATSGDRDCVICFEAIADEQRAELKPCGHLYHTSCVGQWLDSHSTCSYCRVPAEELVSKMINGEYQECREIEQPTAFSADRTVGSLATGIRLVLIPPLPFVEIVSEREQALEFVDDGVTTTIEPRIPLRLYRVTDQAYVRTPQGETHQVAPELARLRQSLAPNFNELFDIFQDLLRMTVNLAADGSIIQFQALEEEEQARQTMRRSARVAALQGASRHRSNDLRSDQEQEQGQRSCSRRSSSRNSDYSIRGRRGRGRRGRRRERRQQLYRDV